MPQLQDQDFIINVGPHSTFNRSGHYQTLPKHIDAMFSAFEQRGEKKIALYFHGGLVNEANGLASARNMAPHIQTGGYAPVCFVWETGLIETISTNLSKISGTKLFNKLLIAILKKVSERITISDPLGRGTAMTGLSEPEIRDELAKPIPFEDFHKVSPAAGGRGPGDIDELAGSEFFVTAEIRDELRPLVENDPEFVAAIANARLSVTGVSNGDGARGIIDVFGFVQHAAKIVYRIIKRYLSKRDHGFYPTVVEEILREFYIAEIGAWVWKAMKDKSDEMWQNNDGLQGLDQLVGRYFLDKLIAYAKKNPDLQISLIGHSAGSIAICNLLKCVKEISVDLNWDHIILMAPACTVELFQREIIDSPPTRLENIRIFTMSDEYECQDVLVPFVYTRSLLYLISGVLEDEADSFDAYILGLERHIGYKAPYNIDILTGCHDYLYMTGLSRLCFAVSTGSVSGLQTGARKHGDFDDDPATINSIISILQQ